MLEPSALRSIPWAVGFKPSGRRAQFAYYARWERQQLDDECRPRLEAFWKTEFDGVPPAS